MANPIKYSDLVVPDDSITRLVAQLRELDEVFGQSLKNIRDEASKLSKELKSVSGATEEGRATTKAAATDADRLAKAQQRLEQAQSDNAAELEKVNQATREAQRLTKLTAKLNNAAEGSYDKLSAQYSLNKMRLNAMSKAERNATKDGIALETQTKEIYEEMKRLQAATGQYQLNVGNYASGFSAVGFQVQQLARELPTLAVGLPQFFLALSNNIPMLTDAIAKEREQIALAKKENKEFVPLGKQLAKSIFSWQTALIVAISALTIYGKEIGAWVKQLFKGKDAMDDFRNSISGMVGSVAQERAELGALFNALNKAEQGTANYVAVRNTILDKYGDLLENEREEVRNLNNIAEAYDLIQKKISGKAVVEGFSEQIEEQSKKYGETYKTYFDDLLPDFIEKFGDEGVAKLTEYLGLLSEGTEESIEAAKTIESAFNLYYGDRVKGNSLRKDWLLFSGRLPSDFIPQKFAELNQEITASIKAQQQAMEMYGAVAPDGKKDGGAGGADDEYNRAKRSLELQQAFEKESLKSQEQYQYDSDLSAQDNEALRVQHQQEYNAQEFEMEQRHKEEMLKLEEQYGKISAEDARKTREIYAQEETTFQNEQLAEDQQRQAEAAKRAEEIYQRNLKARRAKEDAELANEKDSWEKRRTEINRQYEREIEDLQHRLKTEKNLTEDERESINATIIALRDKQSREISKTYMDESEEYLNLQYDLSLSEIEALETTEDEKTRLRLEAEKKRLKLLIKLGKYANNTELNMMKNAVKAINNELKSLYANRDIYDILGFKLNDDQKDSINTTLGYAKQAVSEYLSLKEQAASESVAQADDEVEAAQRVLDAELQARANGYANNVEQAQKELDLAKRTRAKALAEQKKAQSEQEAINSIQQVSDLVTASAKIWAQLGFPSAIPALGTMWGSFAYAKIKANQLATEQYGEGTVELLEGGSHASGHDIDLGMKADGTRRRAEGGEFFAVINKRNSARYRNIIPSLINSLNDGTFERYMTAFKDGGIQVNVAQDRNDLSGLGRDVREIKEQGLRREYSVGSGRVRIYKNLKQRLV